MSLKISDALALPIDTVTDTIGILAIKGAGKTYTFLVLVEEMVKQGLPVVVLDPVGVCWGLRSRADGHGVGLPVVIVGGQHGDLPLEEGAGFVLADWVIAERRPAVFDLSELPTKAASIRFALDFLSRLYAAARREPIHVVLDEADEFCPQKPFGEETRMLRAVEVLVRRGRAKGIGVTMVTQRPAVLSKNVLTQIGTLIVGRTTSPQDRKAVDEWVMAHATPEQRKTFMASLASLPTREKWVWSPARDVFARVAIRARATFDSSATPKVGEVRVEPSRLAPVDLAALRDRISSTIEQAKADDPKVLRAQVKERDARIAELERQAEAAKIWTEPQRVEVPAPYIPEALMRAVAETITGLKRHVDDLVEGLAGAQHEGARIFDGAPSQDVERTPELGQRRAAPKPPDRLLVAAMTNGAVHLRAGERRLLEVVARHHPVRLTRAQLATLAGFAASGGTYQTYLSVLRRAGYLEEDDGLVGAAAAGLATAGVQARRPMSRAEVLEQWRSALRKGERDMLDAVVKHREVTRERLGELTDIAPSGGTFGTYLSVLRRNELVVVDGPNVRLGKALAEARP